MTVDELAGELITIHDRRGGCKTHLVYASLEMETAPPTNDVSGYFVDGPSDKLVATSSECGHTLCIVSLNVVVTTFCKSCLQVPRDLTHEDVSAGANPV